MKMPIFPDAIITALLGYGVVFVGLILLMAVVVITGKVMTAKKTAPAASAAAPAPGAKPQAAAKEGPAAPGSAGQIMLHGVADKDAAMLMAIVADKLGKPINELRFKSIKEVK